VNCEQEKSVSEGEALHWFGREMEARTRAVREERKKRALPLKIEEEGESMKDCPIAPLGTRVILNQLTSEKVTKSGIIMPESAQKKLNVARVLAVGPQVKEFATLKPGAAVIFDKFTLVEIEYNGELYGMIEEANIFGVVPE